MASVHTRRAPRAVYYPTSDGKPIAETDTHRDDMVDLIETLRTRFRGKKVYVTGNILVYYEEGNPRKVFSPDVWAVRGVAQRPRDNYLIWREGKGPEVAMEITSKTTRREDQGKKFVLYRDVIKVKEYILFDPFGDYLKPRLQGYRLVKGDYLPIKLVDGRLPSKVLGLHLEPDGTRLRLFDPVTKTYLLNPREEADEAQARRREAEAELERVRRELEELRRAQRNGS